MTLVLQHLLVFRQLFVICLSALCTATRTQGSLLRPLSWLWPCFIGPYFILKRLGIGTELHSTLSVHKCKHSCYFEDKL
uniref:Uncharacterized protein n=1 Tax=Arundo donax TaxID=35708 RepID=A0A0A9C9P8_ARUDO